MASDKEREQDDKIRSLEKEIKEIKTQIGNQPIRLASRPQGGGGIRWTEYVGP